MAHNEGFLRDMDLLDQQAKEAEAKRKLTIEPTQKTHQRALRLV